MLFAQSYTIHIDLLGRTIPALYCLLPNKKENTYRRAFHQIRLLVPNFNPTWFMIDFEIAAINSIKIIWPQTLIIGCFFHFNHAFWRNLVQKNLRLKYMENDEFKV